MNCRSSGQRADGQGARARGKRHGGTAGGTRENAAAHGCVHLHWGLVAAVTLSLLTGLRIAADYDGSVAGALSAKVPWLLLRGPVIEWHIWSSWRLTFIAVSYPAFLWRAYQLERVKVDRSVWLRLRLARQRGRLWSDVPAWFAANVLIYSIGFVLIGLMALTGWLLSAGVTLGLGYYPIAAVHGIVAYGFLLYVAPVLSQPEAPTDHATGLVHEALARAHASLAGCDVYLAGPPPMVEAARATALALGAEPRAIFADAFVPTYGAPSGRRGWPRSLLRSGRRIDR